MLVNPASSCSGWLPLLPLELDAPHRMTTPLPLAACSVEALRETFTPLLFFLQPAPISLPPCIPCPARSSDIPELVKLHDACLPLSFSSSFFLPLLLNDSCLALVCKTTGTGTCSSTVTGAITAHVDHVQNRVQILSLVVHPAARRKGMALQLLSALAERLSPSEFNSLKLNFAILHVQVTNLAAQRLYQQAGFINTGLKRGYYRGAKYGGADAYEMTKAL